VSAPDSGQARRTRGECEPDDASALQDDQEHSLQDLRAARREPRAETTLPLDEPPAAAGAELWRDTYEHELREPRSPQRSLSAAAQGHDARRLLAQR